MGRAFSTSYLLGDAQARAIYPGDFRDPAIRSARAHEASRRRVDPALAALLLAQDDRLPPSAARRRNLEALAAGGAAAVVTGQQVGLFLGPLYSFYKAATAVAAARAVEAESGVRCVPLFWLQTEDHDFAEVAACTVAGRDGQPVRLGLAPSDADAALARTSIAHRVLGDDVVALVDALADALPPGAAADEVVALLRACYRPGRPVAAAFAAAMASLFADDGLILFDPRDAVVAGLAAPLYRTAIQAADAIDQRLTARGDWLESQGFDQQVAVRSGALLVFHHPEGPAGPRFRPTKRPAEHQRDLLGALERDPLCFSTSALLRPIVQDALLPVVGYVAGPGEINYFAQLPPLYDLFGVAPSLVFPRARFRCLDARTRRLLAETGLGPDDVAEPPGKILPRLGPRVETGVVVDVGVDPVELRRRVDEQIAPAVERIAREVAALGPQLERPAQRARDSVAHALGRLIDRAAATLLQRDQVLSHRIDRLRLALHPEGAPQERFYGWPSLAGRHGALGLKRLVMDRLAACGPFVTAVQDLLP